MEENSSKSNFKCTFCAKTFSRIFNLKRHLKNLHNAVHSTFKEGKNFKKFIDFSEFLIWKKQLESETISMYVRQRGNTVRKNGDKILHYYCNRSGVYKPKGKGLKRLKSQGSTKIGASCPAKMLVKITSENVIVHFSPKHENHTLDVEHLRLPQSEREAIADRAKVIRQGAKEETCCSDPQLSHMYKSARSESLWRAREKNQELASKKASDVLPNQATMTQEITVNNPVSMLIEPKLELDFSVENPESVPVERKTEMKFTMENLISNVLNSTSLIIPLGNTENMTLSNVSNSTSSTAPMNNCENATLSHVFNHTSPTAPLNSRENVTLSDVSNSISSLLKKIQNLTDDNVLDKSFPNSSLQKDEIHQNQPRGNQISYSRSDKASTKVPDHSKNNSKATEHCLCCRKASTSSAPIDLNQMSLPQLTISREISEEQQLEIRHNTERAEDKFPEGRFICDLKSVIRQARDIEAHSSKCKFGGSLIYYRMTKKGLVHTFYYSCSNPACDASLKLVTDNGGDSLNKLAVLGSSSTGSGFSQEKEKFRVMNMQYMNKNMYSKYDNLVGQVVRFSSRRNKRDKITMTEEINVNNPGPLLIEPKTVMDFSVENLVSMPLEPKTGMDFSMENPMSVPVEPKTGMGISVDSPISIPVEPKPGMDLIVENPAPVLVEPKIEMDFSVDSATPLPLEPKIGMDLSMSNPVPILVQPKIEMDFSVDNSTRLPVEPKIGMDLSMGNSVPMLVQPKIEMDFSVDSSTRLPLEPQIGMDLSMGNSVLMLVQPKIEMDFSVDSTPLNAEPKIGMDLSMGNPVPMLVQPKIEIDFHVDET